MGDWTSTRAKAWLLLGAVLLSFTAYGTSLGGAFVNDDVPLLVENSCHRSLGRLPALFSPAGHGICALRPMRFISLALDYRVWGDRPVGYHLTNVLLHGAVAWLLMLVLLQLGVASGAILLAGALFVLHPITSEAVANVSGRRDLLMALFSLLALHAYLGYSERRGWWRLPLVWAALGGALLSHEMAAAVPVALLVLELCRRGPRELVRSRALLPLASSLALAGLLATWLLVARGHSERHALWGPDLGAHLATVLRVHAHYLGQLALPRELVADYSPEAFRISASLFEPAALGAGALVASLILLALGTIRRCPLVSAAVLGYFVLLLPVSQIVIHHELLAEHRLYLPSACCAAVLAAGLWALRRRSRLGWVLAGALLLAYGLRTNLRNRDWRDALSLWSATVASAPRCARAHANLGAALAQAGRLESARMHLQTALDIRPNLCAAQLNLGQLLLDRGEPQRGLQLLQQAARCERKPRYLQTLGFAALARGNSQLAAQTFHEALALRPSDADLHLGLGTALQRRREFTAAVREYRLAERLRPAWPKARYRLAQVLAETCQLPAARSASAEFEQVWPQRSPEVLRLRRLIAKMQAHCTPQPLKRALP